MTGLLFDPGFCARHDDPSHPENAGRLSAFVPPAGMRRLDMRPATDEELLAVHTPGHLVRVREMGEAGGGMLDPDTYCGPASEAVARAVSGGVLDLCRDVWRGTLGRGLCVARPPGHHAIADATMGFCLYNHVAVAAAGLLQEGAGRLAILDFDVHHGNGTQDIFYSDGRVFFGSSHQFPHWPGTGRATETGAGPGAGCNLNAPLAPGSGDEEFLAAWEMTIVPAVREFAPEMILVSAGFDAHAADPLAHLEVSDEGFDRVCRLLRATAEEICAGKIVFLLEGGYVPEVLAGCLSRLADLLLGED